MSDGLQSFSSALDDFHRARNRADLRQILNGLTRRSDQLLSFEEVRRQLKASGAIGRGLRDIPLEAVVGSVGRYDDFTRDFLPRSSVKPERWAKVAQATSGLGGLPPIEVYQIGEAYFVQDGNHRVSVARQMGAQFIMAYVTEVFSRVPLEPDVRPDDLIVKAEYAQFLEKTNLDELRPGADLQLTVPGQYPVISEHIDVHRYYMGEARKHPTPYPEAVTHWYDTVYLPVIEVIRGTRLLDSFPNRTEADLYLWLAEHRAALQEELGWEISPEAAAADLLSQQGGSLGSLIDAFTPTPLESGPPPGTWRHEQRTLQQVHLFHEILAAISGTQRGWDALDQALLIAEHEHGRVHGVHTIPVDEPDDTPEIQALREEFTRRCSERGIPGDLAVHHGSAAGQIAGLSRWVDMVVASLSYPPPSQPVARMGSGFRELIYRCSRPVLAVPDQPSAVERPLLAYDGSPKAEEALYVAAYLAGQWQLPLVVVTIVDSGQASSATLDRARQYLDNHGIQASYFAETAPVAETILHVSQASNCDLLITGGYGYIPLLELVLGSTVDTLLRQSSIPMLICR